MGVAFETAAVYRQFVEGVFPIVSVGWVADVVGEAGHFAQVGVEAEAGADAPGDLGDFEGVGEAGAGCVAFLGAHDLGFVGQAAEGGAVEDPGAVAGEGAALVLVGDEHAALGGFVVHAGDVMVGVVVHDDA